MKSSKSEKNVEKSKCFLSLFWCSRFEQLVLGKAHALCSEALTLVKFHNVSRLECNIKKGAEKMSFV